MASDSGHFVVRNAQVVSPDRVQLCDVAVVDGQIVEVGPRLAQDWAAIEASGRYLFPGVLDAHTHFNEPGRTEWEGLASGSRALAAGGGTAFFDMPLNSEPPATTSERLLEKKRLAEAKSVTDFALWGGLIPGNLDELASLQSAGAIGVKAFMCPSGIDSFPNLDGDALRRGMQRAAGLNLLVAVHAEDTELAAQLAAERRSRGETSVRAYLESRPVEAEVRAIRRVLEYAGETGCPLHIVHVSSPEGLDAIAAARRQGVNVSAETCPHYLLLTDLDMIHLGAVAKCAPPLRDEPRRAALWDRLRSGLIDTLGSDHSPSPGSLKTDTDFFSVWGGIGGIQEGVALLLSATADTLDSDWPRLATLLSTAVARRFRLSRRKGLIAPGHDADFSLLRLGGPAPLRAADLLTRHRFSPYSGRPCRVRIEQTFVRGRRAFPLDPAASAPLGQFLRPEGLPG